MSSPTSALLSTELSDAYRLDWTRCNWAGLDWTGLGWTGQDRTGQDRIDLDWTGFDCVSSAVHDGCFHRRVSSPSVRWHNVAPHCGCMDVSACMCVGGMGMISVGGGGEGDAADHISRYGDGDRVATCTWTVRAGRMRRGHAQQSLLERAQPQAEAQTRSVGCSGTALPEHTAPREFSVLSSARPTPPASPTRQAC